MSNTTRSTFWEQMVHDSAKRTHLDSMPEGKRKLAVAVGAHWRFVASHITREPDARKRQDVRAAYLRTFALCLTEKGSIADAK